LAIINQIFEFFLNNFIDYMVRTRFMAEASLAAYGAAIGVAVAVAVVTFSLRQRRPHGQGMDE